MRRRTAEDSWAHAGTTCRLRAGWHTRVRLPLLGPSSSPSPPAPCPLAATARWSTPDASASATRLAQTHAASGGESDSGAEAAAAAEGAAAEGTAAEGGATEGAASRRRRRRVGDVQRLAAAARASHGVAVARACAALPAANRFVASECEAAPKEPNSEAHVVRGLLCGVRSARRRRRRRASRLAAARSARRRAAQSSHLEQAVVVGWGDDRRGRAPSGPKLCL